MYYFAYAHSAISIYNIGNTAASIMALYECQCYIEENYTNLSTDFHIIIGDCEAIVSRAMSKKITVEAKANIKEYHEYPGVDHYVLNNGIYLEEMIGAQLLFLEKVLQ